MNTKRKLLEQNSKQTYPAVELKMSVANKIAEIMCTKKISKRGLATKLGKNPAVITTWLSGCHNFTLETLCEISNALEENIITITPTQKHNEKIIKAQLIKINEGHYSYAGL